MFQVRFSLVAVLFLGLFGEAFAQGLRSTPAGEERIIAVLPLTGAGRKGDVQRPMFFPADGSLPKGVLSYQAVIADDGKCAIVDIRAVNRAAFEFLRNSKLAEVRLFEPHKNSLEEVEREVQALKRGLTMGQLTGGRP